MLDFLYFNRKKLSEAGNNIVRQGMAIDELVNKPVSVLLSDYYNLLVQRQRIDDIENWETMTEAELDTFAAKFFITRETGNKASGSVTVYVDSQTDITIDDTVRIVSNDGLRFVPIDVRVIPAASMRPANDNYGKYFFTLRVTAESNGSSYSKLAGELTAIINNTFDYTFITNPDDLNPGADHETNEQFYTRLQSTINDRSLMNERSIYTILKKNFPYVTSMYIAGVKNKYMKRDRLQAVDLSEPPKQLDFLGKIAGSNSVKSTGYYGIFPAIPGSRGAVFSDPFSPTTIYSYPQTVEAVDLLNPDPGYHGFPLYQEATDEMYRGLFYPDYTNFMNVSTVDMVNIADDMSGVPSSQLVPNSDWIVGAHGRLNGDYGIPTNSALDKKDIIQFSGSTISFKGGVGVPLSAQKNISKRIGMKYTGNFRFPGDPNAKTVPDSAARSSIQMVLGGSTLVDDQFRNIVDAFSGLSLGVYLNESLNADPAVKNASVFLANSERFDSTYAYYQPGDLSVGDIGALATQSTRIVPGKQYRFEFVVFDDLSISIYIEPTDTTVTDDSDTFNNNSPWMIPSTVLSIYASKIKDPNDLNYGTVFKATVNSKSTENTDVWEVSDFKVVDLTEHRPMTLYMFNVEDLDEPLVVDFRATASGYRDGGLQSGYSVYIWNIERSGPISGTTILSNGLWQKLESVSDPDGTKSSVNALLSQELYNSDRYKVSTRFGTVIILMVVADVTSKAILTSSTAVVGDDFNVELNVDYIRIRDQQVDVYRGGNKVDIYVDTLRNVDTPASVSIDLTRDATQPYFTLDSSNVTAPIIEITSVIDTLTGTQLLTSEYSITHANELYIGSVEDVIYLATPNYTDVTVTYTSYPNISVIQDFFDTGEFARVMGNILVRHKYPVYTDFELFYSGNLAPDEVLDSIRSYFDSNITMIFSPSDMSKYLADNAIVSNVKSPISVSYSSTYRNENITSTATEEILEVEFFRLRNITATKI